LNGFGHPVEATFSGSCRAVAVVDRGGPVNGDYHSVKVRPDEIGLVCGVVAVCGGFEMGTQPRLFGHDPAPKDGGVHDLRCGKWLTPEKMDIQCFTREAPGLVGHPVHSGHSGSEGHSFVGAGSAAERAVGTGKVAGPGGDEAEKRGGNGCVGGWNHLFLRLTEFRDKRVHLRRQSGWMISGDEDPE
jgi:hypothetical protein